jgi:hypothetical protein
MLPWEWDCSRPLRSAKKANTHSHGNGLLLQHGTFEHVLFPPRTGEIWSDSSFAGHHLPSLLIPLTINSSFMLCFERSAVIYSKLLTGEPDKHESSMNTGDLPFGQRSTSFFEHDHRFRSLANRSTAGVHTAWARPIRRQDYSSMCDTIYVCREDGNITYFDLTMGASGPEFRSYGSIGALQGFVGSAFASLDLGVSHYDMIITGGDMSCGSLSAVGGLVRVPSSLRD